MPKGVYPRRKLGRPAQAAAKPDPRLKLPKWDYVDSDPKVVECQQKIKELNELIREAKFKADRASDKFLNYKRAIEVLKDKVSTYECSSEEEDKFVKESTGEHLECIAQGFIDVVKDLQNLLLEQSREHVKHCNSAAELEAAETALRKTWIDARNKATQQWNAAQQPEAVK